MSYFPHAKDFHVNTLLQIENYNAQNINAGFEMLQEHVATRAMNNTDEYDQPKCHPRTRERVQQEIVNWAKDATIDKHIQWIYGPAGAGKSAISRSVADRQDMSDVLCGYFAFWRTSSVRNHVKPLVPTLAYQLIRRFPETKKFVCEAINDDPKIFEASFEYQLRTLIVKPLETAFEAELKTPKCIILDGLDECVDRKMQPVIIQGLEVAVSGSTFPLRFIVFSRAEAEIRTVFKKKNIVSCSTIVELNERFNPNFDIDIYLREKFEEIKISHDMFHATKWPTESQIDKLVRKSSGQFIYPATIIRYIENLRGNPVDHLRRILELSVVANDNPFAEQDALYAYVLTAMAVRFEDILPIIMAMISLNHTNRDMNFISMFTEIPISNMRVLVTDLHSLINVPKNEDNDMTFYHASFPEFLEDQTRANIFYISRFNKNVYKVKQCMRRIHVAGPVKNVDKVKQPTITVITEDPICTAVQRYCVRTLFYELARDFDGLLAVLKKDYGHDSFVNALRHNTREYGWAQIMVVKGVTFIVTITGGVPLHRDLCVVPQSGISPDGRTNGVIYLSMVSAEGSTSYWVNRELQDSNLIKYLNQWFLSLVDDGSCKMGIGVHKTMSLVITENKDTRRKFDAQAVRGEDHSRLLEYLLGWISEINDLKNLNVTIQFFFLVLRNLFTSSAMPTKDLGQSIKRNRGKLVRAFGKLGMEKSRIKKMTGYMDDILKKCNGNDPSSSDDVLTYEENSIIAALHKSEKDKTFQGRLKRIRNKFLK